MIGAAVLCGVMRTRPSRRRPSLRHDRGSGTVWVIALMALVWLMAVVVMSVGGVRAARHRAHAAADLAALAAAAHAMDGPAKACGLAVTVARAARGRLTACVLRERVAGVKVVVASRVPGFGSFYVTAVARAGPAFPQPSRTRAAPDFTALTGVPVRLLRWPHLLRRMSSGDASRWHRPWLGSSVLEGPARTFRCGPQAPHEGGGTAGRADGRCGCG